jgi:hypothetical protein
MKTALKSSVLHYPELYDRVNNGNSSFPELTRLPGTIIQPCVTSFLRGSCPNGHFFVKALVCGKEWCPDCGKENSIIHKRRMERWWGKIMQMKKVGYLVITIPEQLREIFKNEDNLKEWRKYLTRKLQRLGYDRGLSRFHWAGDCPICEGHGCRVCYFTGGDSEYKPHLNILIEQGFINKKSATNPGETIPGTTIEKNSDWDNKINLLRNDMTNWFNRNFKSELDKHNLQSFEGNIFFSYCGLHKKTKTDIPHRIHKLKYITRATFRHYNSKIADLLKGFRTTSTWGKWDKEKKGKTELAALENNLCPCCIKEEVHIPVTWGGFMTVYELLKHKNLTTIEGGYFQINNSS